MKILTASLLLYNVIKATTSPHSSILLELETKCHNIIQKSHLIFIDEADRIDLPAYWSHLMQIDFCRELIKSQPLNLFRDMDRWLGIILLGKQVWLDFDDLDITDSILTILWRYIDRQSNVSVSANYLIQAKPFLIRNLKISVNTGLTYFLSKFSYEIQSSFSEDIILKFNLGEFTHLAPLSAFLEFFNGASFYGFIDASDYLGMFYSIYQCIRRAPHFLFDYLTSQMVVDWTWSRIRVPTPFLEDFKELVIKRQNEGNPRVILPELFADEFSIPEEVFQIIRNSLDRTSKASLPPHHPLISERIKLPLSLIDNRFINFAVTFAMDTSKYDDEEEEIIQSVLQHGLPIFDTPKNLISLSLTVIARAYFKMLESDLITEQNLALKYLNVTVKDILDIEIANKFYLILQSLSPVPMHLDASMADLSMSLL